MSDIDYSKLGKAIIVYGVSVLLLDRTLHKLKDVVEHASMKERDFEDYLKGEHMPSDDKTLRRYMKKQIKLYLKEMKDKETESLCYISDLKN